MRHFRPFRLRITAAQKLLALMLLGIGLFWLSTLWALALVVAAVAVAYPIAGVPLRYALKLVRDLAFILGIVCVTQAWLQGPMVAAVTFARILALVWAAGLMTSTTTFSEMMEALRRGLTPLRCVGVEPARLAFAMTLAIRFVPLLRQVLQESREAQLARGLGRNPITLIVPVMIRVIRLADRVSEAIEARGVFGEEPEGRAGLRGDRAR